MPGAEPPHNGLNVTNLVNSSVSAKYHVFDNTQLEVSCLKPSTATHRLPAYGPWDTVVLASMASTSTAMCVKIAAAAWCRASCSCLSGGF